MVYGSLLLTVCARVDLKYTSVPVCFVWGLICDGVCFFLKKNTLFRCFVFVWAWCLMCLCVVCE